MDIQIQKVEEFEVIPEAFKKEDKPLKLIFRTPNTIDNINAAFLGVDVNETLCNCFVRFENKPNITDSDGQEMEYFTYKQMMTLGSNPILAGIHADCLVEMTKKIQETTKKAEKTQKKSK